MADSDNKPNTTEEQEQDSTMNSSNSEEAEMQDEKDTNSSDVKDQEEKDEAEEDDDDESEEEEELPPGLLEQPLEISGKREKKKVERLSASMTKQPGEKKKVEIEEGSGSKLGDISFIEHQINATKASDLKLLHRLLFLRIGALKDTKKNIRQFSGFTHSKESKEHEKRTVLLNKIHMPELKTICMVLSLERSGAKKEIVERIIEFLMNPDDKGKKVPIAKKRRSKSKGDGKKEKKKGTKRKRKPKQTKEKVENDKEDEDLESMEEDEDDEGDEKEEVSEQEIEEEEESEEEAPKKKKAKVEPKKKASPKVNGKKEKPPPKKKEPKKSSPKKKPVEVLEDSLSDDSDSDDEPIAKMIKPSPPSNDEIKVLVQKILDGADLESVTMKTVVKEVYSKYPTFDLSDRKDFIKTTVREIIS